MSNSIKAMKRMVVCALLLMACSAEASLWDEYDELLSQYVQSGKRQGIEVNLVDYDGLEQSPAFDSLVNQIRSFPMFALVDKKEKLAFYINAYNILTIQLIIDHQPEESIKDIGNIFSGPWDKVVLQHDLVGLTLDDIEHKIIRPMGEPRIHFAVVCASLSCPDLRTTAYRANKLESQLESQTKIFLDQQSKGFKREKDKIYLSKIFDWYKEDFEASGGVHSFVARYHKEVNDSRAIDYLDYNWMLNKR